MSLNRTRLGSNAQPRHRLADAIASKQDSVRDAAINELLCGGNEVEQAIPALAFVLEDVPAESQEVIREVFRRNKYEVERYFSNAFNSRGHYETIDAATQQLRLLKDAGVVASLNVIQGYNRSHKEKVFEGLKSNAVSVAEPLLTEIVNGNEDRSQVASMVLTTLRSQADVAIWKALSQRLGSQSRPCWAPGEHSLTSQYSEQFANQLEDELNDFFIEYFRRATLEESHFHCNAYHYAYAIATLCPNPHEVADLFIGSKRRDYGLEYDDDKWVRSIGLHMLQFTGTSKLHTRGYSDLYSDGYGVESELRAARRNAADFESEVAERCQETDWTRFPDLDQLLVEIAANCGTAGIEALAERHTSDGRKDDQAALAAIQSASLGRSLPEKIGHVAWSDRMLLKLRRFPLTCSEYLSVIEEIVSSESSLSAEIARMLACHSLFGFSPCMPLVSGLISIPELMEFAANSISGFQGFAAAREFASAFVESDDGSDKIMGLQICILLGESPVCASESLSHRGRAIQFAAALTILQTDEEAIDALKVITEAVAYDYVDLDKSIRDSLAVMKSLPCTVVRAIQRGFSRRSKRRDTGWLSSRPIASVWWQFLPKNVQRELLPTMISDVLKELKSGDEFARIAALDVLLKQGELPENSMHSLLVAMGDSNAKVRKKAIQCLRKITSSKDRSLEAVREVIQNTSEEDDVRGEALVAYSLLSADENDLIEKLAPYLNSYGGNGLIDGAVRAFRNVGEVGAQVVSSIRSLARSHKSEYVRGEAIKTLVELDPNFEEFVKTVIEDDDKLYVKETAANAGIGRGGSALKLLRQLHKRDMASQHRGLSFEVSNTICDTENDDIDNFAATVELLENPVRYSSASAIEEEMASWVGIFSSGERPHLMSVYKIDNDSEKRFGWIERASVKYPNSTIVTDRLITASTAVDRRIRLQVARALSHRRDHLTQIIPTLLHLTADWEPAVRVSALESILKLNAEERVLAFCSENEVRDSEILKHHLAGSKGKFIDGTLGDESILGDPTSEDFQTALEIARTCVKNRQSAMTLALGKEKIFEGIIGKAKALANDGRLDEAIPTVVAAMLMAKVELDKAKTEAQRLKSEQQQRKANGQCILCGTRLGLLARLLGGSKCPACK